MDGNGRVSAPRLHETAALGDVAPLSLHSWDGAAAPLSTEARVAHDGARLLVGFHGRSDGLRVDRAAPVDRPTARLWEHDVVEVFVADRTASVYREIEVSPLGQWLTLAFDGLRRPAPGEWIVRPEVAVSATETSIDVALAVPLDALGLNQLGRIGLFRIAGPPSARTHLSLLPAGDTRPDFHRPDAWAELVLE